MTYGCFDRAPLGETVLVQDGWHIQQKPGDTHLSRVGRMIEIPDPMTKSCQYSKDSEDTQCDGCKRNSRAPAHFKENQ